MDVNLAHNVLEEHGTSFSRESIFLRLLLMMLPFHRFCRTVDDEVDEARDVHTATENLWLEAAGWSDALRVLSPIPISGV